MPGAGGMGCYAAAPRAERVQMPAPNQLCIGEMQNGELLGAEAET